MKVESLPISWTPFGIYVTSGSGEDDKPDCELVLYLWRWSVRVSLPQIVMPHTERVVPNWDAATVARLGRDYYLNYTRRDYGFMFSGEGFLNVYLGRQSNDSSTEQRWACFLPWTQWRHVRHSMYGLDGQWLCDEPRERGPGAFHDWYQVKESSPCRGFSFLDFDGEEIVATTRIEEREWHFGTGWFKWLSWFRSPKIRRSLDISFSKETGKRKGSWKGGTLGHGIDMLPGELHEAAFRRYCSEHNMTFLHQT